MKKILKWIGIALGVVLVVALVAGAVLYFMGSARLSETYDVQAEVVSIPTDEAALERGETLARLVCAECHAGDLAGEALIEESLLTLYSANLTPGEGGIGELSDADLIRAIRHGIDQDDTPLIIMPAEIFVNWSEEDLGAVIAFLRTLAPVDQTHPEPNITIPARIMIQLGLFGNPFPADYVNHDQPFTEMPGIGVTEEYGQYLASAVACTLCHGQNLAGGIEPANFPPGELPTIPNLTPAGNLGDWTEEDFAQVLRTGVTPDGSEIDPDHMPWEMYVRLSEDDISALWLYVQSLPAADRAVE